MASEKNPQSMFNSLSQICQTLSKIYYINIENHDLYRSRVEAVELLNFTLIPSLTVALDNSDTKLIITSK